jgi:hypothetical protein
MGRKYRERESRQALSLVVFKKAFPFYRLPGYQNLFMLRVHPSPASAPEQPGYFLCL